MERKSLKPTVFTLSLLATMSLGILLIVFAAIGNPLIKFTKTADSFMGNLSSQDGNLVLGLAITVLSYVGLLIKRISTNHESHK